MKRVGLIGTGYIARLKHLPAWQRRRTLASVVAVADPDDRAAQALATEFEISGIYPDADTMLESEQLDIVDVCTPPFTHHDLVVRSLTAGCHVLIEKPMAVSLEECDSILEAEARTGRKVCVAHSDLFYPPFQKALDLVRKGRIGEFRGLRIFLSTPTNYMTSNETHWAHRLPGGVIGESGPHIVYLSLAFLGTIQDVRVEARRQLDFPWSRFDDYRLDLIGPHATSSADCVYTSDQWAATVDIWGSSGILTLDLELMTLIERRRATLDPATLGKDGLRIATKTIRDAGVTATKVLLRRYETTHDVLIARFLQAIDKDGDAPVTAREGREAVKAMQMIAEAVGD